MEDAIRQRINEILSFYEITINRFSNGDSALQNRLSRQLSRGSAITSDTICLILSRFSDVSSDWLLRGEGEMFKPQQKPTVISNNEIMIEKTLTERFKELINAKSASVLDFSRLIGVAQTTLNSQLLSAKGISSSVIMLTLNTFSDISAEWLLRGEGEMIKPQQKPAVAVAGAAIGAAIGVLSEPGISAISTLNGLSSSTEPENEDINKDSQDEQIESQRTIEVLIKVIETYQDRVDDLSNVVESLKNENAKLKSQLENKKAS